MDERQQKNFLTYWLKGMESFNQGEYWNAHEFLEFEWLKLPQKEKLTIQAMIQASAAFYLILNKKRWRPAEKLCLSAFNKLQRVKSIKEPSLLPQWETPQLEETLKKLAEVLQQTPPPNHEPWEEWIH